MTTSDDVTTSPLVRGVLLVLFVLLVVPMLMMATMMPMSGFGGGMWESGTTVAPIWGFATMVLFVVLLAGIGYGLYRVVTDHTASVQDPAFQELRIAYARGELSDEEFEKRRAKLEQTE